MPGAAAICVFFCTRLGRTYHSDACETCHLAVSRPGNCNPSTNDQGRDVIMKSVYYAIEV